VLATVRRIEERFPSNVILFEGDNRIRAIAALSVAEVIFVNPVADGMNLLAQEAAVLDSPSALVLSRAAGRSDLLSGGAVSLNDPLDIEQTATALEGALAMPVAERIRRGNLMRDVVVGAEPAAWLKSLLADLAMVTGCDLSEPPSGLN
jgi:trehalose 6-phosphate synthase